MTSLDLSLNRGVVFTSALVYWAGVYLQTRRIRRRIGRAPNVKPRGTKEKILWAGWFLVVLAWLTLPLLAGNRAPAPWLIIPSLCAAFGFYAGIALTVLGYAGTLWCYSVMGNNWRMGVNRAEKNRLVTGGPFQFVRHPIYVFQICMLAGAALLLPAPIALAILVIHIVCIVVKARDEEDYLLTTHGEDYGNYRSRTGRFIPKLRFRSKL